MDSKSLDENNRDLDPHKMTQSAKKMVELVLMEPVVHKINKVRRDIKVFGITAQ